MSPLGTGLPGGLRLSIGTAPNGAGRHAFSRSRVDGIVVELTAPGGAVGVDAETRERVAGNATADDPWLTTPERDDVARSGDPVLALACHWVLKEAYGKALGVGLALPLDRTGFAARDGRIAAEGFDGAGWTFLLRACGDLIVGVAHHPGRPFTPAGKKPPAPPPER